MVLISLPKQIRKKFPSYHCFRHNAFITSQSLFVPTNMVLKKYLAYRTFCKCQSHSNESCLSKRTYTYKIDADNQLHNCVCGARCLSRWRCYKFPCKITGDKTDWIAIALTLHRNVKVNYSRSTEDFLHSKQHRQLLNSKKAIFEIWRLTDILFR